MPENIQSFFNSKCTPLRDLSKNLVYRLAFAETRKLESGNWKEHGKQKDEIIEALKKHIPVYILTEIEELNEKAKDHDSLARCILLIGEDSNLIGGIVSYIFWYHYECLDEHNYSFHLKSLLGLDNKSVTDLLQHFESGSTVFLENLHYTTPDILKLIGDRIRDICRDVDVKSSYTYSVESSTRDLLGIKEECNALYHKFGRLIISTNSKDSLSDEFVKQFVVIHLEPEKQGQSNGQDTISGNVFHKEGDFWKIQYNGELTRINHYVGIGYITYLLENKDRDFYVCEVMQAVNKKQFQNIRNSLKSTIKGQGDFFGDNQEVDIYDQNITVKNTLNDYNETIRKRVSKNIKDALGHIKECNKDIWEHLSNSINTGNTLSYKPKNSIQWDIKR